MEKGIFLTHDNLEKFSNQAINIVGKFYLSPEDKFKEYIKLVTELLKTSKNIELKP
jgi:peptide subunit release factor 1 (eRF1)